MQNDTVILDWSLLYGLRAGGSFYESDTFDSGD